MHLVQTMAYTGEKPWHGLGNHLPPKQSLEVWKRAAGMDWSIEEAEVRFVAAGNKNLGSIHAFPEQKVLYRSDNKAALSVVSARYQVVQPAEILEFYRDLTEHSGFELESAGVLKEGKKLFALARTGQSVTLKGKDTVNGYLLLATACDGTLATTAQHTSIRVVCNNTLQVALGNSAGAVKVGHRSQFDAQAVKRQLGIATSSWDAFIVRMKALSEYKVSDSTVEAFLRRVLTYSNTSASNRDALAVNERAIKAIGQLYAGRGKGAELASARGTLWGVLNATTEYVDHVRVARSDDNRRDSAWFGSGAALKGRAWDEALKLVV